MSISPPEIKRPRKKNVIPTSRLEQLAGDSLIYEVRCVSSNCSCYNPEAGCGRGFFSLFIQAINGVAFAKRFRLPYFINFGNTNYAYSQPGREDQNFWNYYFDQPIKRLENPAGTVVNEFIETYPLRIWDKAFIRGLAEVISKELVYREEVKRMFHELKTKFQGKRVLGVHFRSTDHHQEVLPVKITEYFKEIDKRIPRFDHLFLATDDQAIVVQFSERYGDILWLNPVVRSKNGQALHSDSGNSDRYQLGLDALVECYSLSQCQAALLTNSNLSYASLLFNPELSYQLMERAATRLRRLTTLTLYYLDKWNVRKW